LGVDIFSVEEVHECIGAFVVQALEERFQAGFGEACVDLLVGSQDGRPFAIFDGLGKDEVRVMVTKAKYVQVAAAGPGGELSSLVGVGLSRMFDE
jgi:hypothetical protein